MAQLKLKILVSFLSSQLFDHCDIVPPPSHIHDNFEIPWQHLFLLP